MKLSGVTMPARMTIHRARWSTDHAMPSHRRDTGEEGMSWQPSTRPAGCGGGPHWLAETFVGRPACPEIFGARRTCTTRAGGDAVSTTGHREVDIGRRPCGAPKQSERYPGHCPELAWGEPVESLEGRSACPPSLYENGRREGSASEIQILPARLDSEEGQAGVLAKQDSG